MARIAIHCNKPAGGTALGSDELMTEIPGYGVLRKYRMPAWVVLAFAGGALTLLFKLFNCDAFADGLMTPVAFAIAGLAGPDRRLQGMENTGGSPAGAVPGKIATTPGNSDAMLNSIFRAAPVGIGLVVDRVITEANDLLCEMTGYRRNELVGSSAGILYLAVEDLEYADREKYAQIERRGIGTVETRWRRKDGRIIEVLLSSTPLDPHDLAAGVTFTALDITERKRDEAALRESEAKFRVLTETTASAIVILQDNRVKYANPAVEKITGYTLAEMVAMNPIEAASVIDPVSFLMLNLARFRRKGSDRNLRYEIRLRTKGGEIKWVDVTTGMFNYNGRPAFLATGFDTTERRRTEERLRASLREKDVLLKEVHHRVKNNLQVVSSMLSLQSTSIDDPQLISMLRESQDRVRSMALIHEKLYKSDDLSGINFEEYVRNLTSYLVRTYKVPGNAISLNIDAVDILMSVDLAIPCGLIINELVSNSLKYAFPDGRAGTITVSTRREGREYILVVGDDGVGMPADLDYRNTGSLGLQLVNLLVTQLEGSISMSQRNGTWFMIKFMDKK